MAQTQANGGYGVTSLFDGVTRSNRLVSRQQESKSKTNKPPQQPTQTNKIWPICESETGETCVRSHYLAHSSKTPALTTSSAARRMPYFQQLDALWPTVARTCRQGVTKAKVKTLTSRPGSMKIEKSCVPVWRALAYLIQIKQKCLTRLYPGIPTSMSEWSQTEQSSPFQVQ